MAVIGRLGFANWLFTFSTRARARCPAGWIPLAFDTTPNYTDTTALPATPAKWKHRAIYRVGDHQVGVWSNTMEIMVG